MKYYLEKKNNVNNIVKAKYDGGKIIVDKLNSYTNLKKGDLYVYMKGNRVVKEKHERGYDVTNFDRIGRVVHSYDIVTPNIIKVYDKEYLTYLPILIYSHNVESLDEHIRLKDMGKMRLSDDIIQASLIMKKLYGNRILNCQYFRNLWFCLHSL